jgi:threonine/homoserine/homoserine lactone efflux protein
MEPTAALIAGLVAGLAIAMQVGAVSLLLIETAIARGPRVAVAAGMGVATVDFGFAIVATAAGGAAGAALASNETAIRVVAACVLAVIAVHGLVGLARERRSAVATAAAGGAEPVPGALRSHGSAGAHYARFILITAANPLTIASFAAVAAGLSLDGTLPAAAFALGVGAASAGWHLVLTLAAGHAARWITPSIRRGLGVVGRLIVLAIAAHLALH